MVQAGINHTKQCSIESVAITGMGVVCALGRDLASLKSALRAGRSGIGAADHIDLPLTAAALLDDVDFSSSLDTLVDLPEALPERARQVAGRASRVAQTAVESTLQAWQQASLCQSAPPSERIGLIIGGHNLGSRLSYEHYQRYHSDWDYIPASYGLQCLDTDLVGVISEVLHIRGPGFTVGGASASGQMALIQGQQLIQSGSVDMCLVVGAMADLSPAEVQAWRNMGAMGGHGFPLEQACRPFDRDRNGFIYGQGCGAVVLENPDSAKRRQIQPLALLKGSAVVLDGNRLPNPNAEGEARAMSQALQRAGLAAADIAYISTHGTASVLGDATEVEAIRQVFQGHLQDLRINATKGLTGHCLYAAGVIETIATVLQMQGDFVHPNLNLENPIDTVIPFVGEMAESAKLLAALSNSFGFGGINTAIVLTQPM